MTQPGFHLAEINVARLVAPLDSPPIKDFVDNLDRINALADASPGFIWRLQGEGDSATDLKAFADPLIITNMSVWTDIESLGAYVYRSGHIEIMRRRRDFFEAPTEASVAMWWVKAGTVPSVARGLARLEHLRRKGPTPFAFSFKQPFPPRLAVGPASPVLDECG